MHRQSLGSPASKHQIHGGGGGEKEEEIKAEKLIRSSSRTARSIHLIPVFTLLCFLVLYLCSYDPSLQDLGSVEDTGRSLDPNGTMHVLDPNGATRIGRYFGSERGDVSAIRSHRGLKELRHRKLRIL